MTSVKKGKLLITLIIFGLICVLVPVIIAATIKQTASIQSTVSFSLQDIEGKFGYGVYGAAKGDNTENKFMPTLFFESAFNTSTNEIDIKDANGQFFTSNNFELDLGNLELDENHKKVDLYFFFVNTATLEGYNNRTITLSFADNSDFKGYEKTQTQPGLFSYWQYTSLTSSTANQFDIEQFQIGTVTNWTNLYMDDTVDVAPKTHAGMYTMAIIKYTLQISEEWDTQNTFGDDPTTQPVIDLTINFNSQSSLA